MRCLSIVFYALITALSGIGAWAQEFDEEASEKKYRELVERLVRELSTSAASDVLNQLTKIDRQATQEEIAATLIQKNVHRKEAALGLLWIHRMDYEYGIEFNRDIEAEILPTLLDWLEGKIPRQVDVAAKYLRQMDVIPETFADRIRRLAEHENPYARAEACHLITKLPTPLKGDLETLIKCLGDVDNIVIKSALQVATKMNAPELLPFVRANLKHIDDDVRIEAAKAVLQMDKNDSEPIHVLEDLYFNSTKEGTKKSVLYAMEDLDARVLENLEMLLDALAAPSEVIYGVNFGMDMGMSRSALSALNSAGQTATGVIGEWLANDSTPIEVRARLLRLLTWSAFDPAELREVVEKHVAHQDISIRKSAIQVLARIGEVDSDLVIEHMAVGDDIRQAAAAAFGRTSETTRSSAVEAIKKLLEDESPYVRVDALKSDLILRNDPATETNVLIELLPDLESIGWEASSSMTELVRELRPTPGILINQIDAALKQDSEENSKLLDILGAADGSAFDSRVALLSHLNGNVRASALKQLGSSGDVRAIPHIVRHLDDHGDYTVYSGDTGYGTEVRVASMEALASPGLNTQSIIPLLTDRLSDPLLRSAAVQALGQAGEAGRVALPALHALEITTPDGEALYIAIAIARLEPDSQKKIQGFEKLFQVISSPRFCCFRLYWPFDKTIVQLADEGVDVHHLKEPLTALALEKECLHRSCRIRAAYALAVLEPTNLQWRRMLEHWKSQEPFGRGDANECIKLLNQRQNDPK